MTEKMYQVRLTINWRGGRNQDVDLGLLHPDDLMDRVRARLRGREPSSLMLILVPEYPAGRGQVETPR